MKSSALFSFIAALATFWVAGVTRSHAQGPVDAFNPNTNGVVNAALVQADGKVVIAGNFTTVRGQPRARIARLLADGTLDYTYNPGADRAVTCLALQADGKLLIGGDFIYVGGQLHPSLVRLTSSGSVDSTFKGVADGGVKSIAIASDGRVVIGGGFFKLDGVPLNFIGRLTATGSLDATFHPVLDGAVSSIAIESSTGRIVIGGAFYNLGGVSCYHLGRLTSIGAVDTSFNPGVTTTGATVAQVNTIAIQTGGQILVGGSFAKIGGQPRANMGRLLANGTVDSTFNPGADGPVRCIVLQPADESILVGGHFSTVGGCLRSNLCRMSGSGSMDTPFNPQANGTVNTLAVQTNGSIVAGGEFQILGGQTRNFAGRLISTYVSGTDATLANLQLDVPDPDLQTGTISPEFSASETSYSVGTTRHAIAVIPESTDAGASIFTRVNAGAFSRVVSGSSSALLTLAVGSNAIEVKVVAADGFTTTIYRISVTRSLSADASLTDLTLDGASLHPTFTTSGTRYSIELWTSLDDASGSAIRIIPIRSNLYSSVVMQVNGGAYQAVSGTSGPILLRSGVNTVDIQVTSENRQVTKLYRLLTESIPASANANLASLVLSQGTLAPEFVNTSTSYSALISGSTITVRPVAENANSILSVSFNSGSSQTIVSGQASSVFALDPGVNTVNIDVMAESGVDFNTYQISVTRVDAPVMRAPGLTSPGYVNLAGSVDALIAASGTALFEYGTTTSYGHTALASISGSPAVASATLSGLDSSFAYQIRHYRIVLQLGADVYYGPDQTFVTSWPTTSPVVISGDAVPGMSGVKFQALSTPCINANGDVAFQTSVWGTGVSRANSSLLWVESDPTGHQVARAADPAPGVSGATFLGFSDPEINKAGTVTFMGTMTPGVGEVTSSDCKGLWTTLSGSLRLVARQQHVMQIPDAPSAKILSLHNFALPDTGGPIFMAYLVSGTGGVTAANNQGVWGFDSVNGLREMVRTGDLVDDQGRLQRVILGPLPTPSTGSSLWIQRASTHGGWRAEVIPNNGSHAATPPWYNVLGPISKAPDGYYQWIVRDSSGVVRLFLRRTDQIASRKISLLNVFSGTPETTGQNRSFNAGRDLALSIKFADNSQGLLRIAPNLSGSLLISHASAVPGIPGTSFDWIYGPAISDAGYVAFRTRITGLGVSALNNTAIFAGRGRLSPMARTGGATPGITGAVFASLNDPLYNSSGQIAFLGTVRGGLGVTSGNATGLWASGTNGKLRLVARVGAGVVPGYPAAARFSLVRQFVLPDKGGALFLADVTGVATTDNQGLWAADAAGHVRLVVRKGGGLMVDGKARQIASLSILTGASETLGQKRAFTDGSQLVYKVTFTDSTQGIFQLVLN